MTTLSEHAGPHFRRVARQLAAGASITGILLLLSRLPFVPGPAVKRALQTFSHQALIPDPVLVVSVLGVAFLVLGLAGALIAEIGAWILEPALEFVSDACVIAAGGVCVLLMQLAPSVTAWAQVSLSFGLVMIGISALTMLCTYAIREVLMAPQPGVARRFIWLAACLLALAPCVVLLDSFGQAGRSGMTINYARRSLSL